MPLTPGARLGPYEIVAPIGKGGMGEVYAARDTRLNRDVAIKVLPDAFAHDPERLARLTREAQALAALNHPNIAQIYGLERLDHPRGASSSSPTALVMELVEGDDLSRLITQGALSRPDTLSIARQIAEALEAAHEQGIIHRDLKPANIKIRLDGTVKVLDFGLAKAFGPDSAADLANSPTVTGHQTERGVILGTAAYMAPEQARGKVVDKRADIWAFGAVLYEMLTGAPAFSGQTFTDVLAAVVRHELDWSKLPADTPRALRALLSRCIEADPKKRLRDIGEARVAIAAIEQGPADAKDETQAPVAARPAPSARTAWMVAGAMAIAAVGILVWHLMTAAGSRDAAGAKAVLRLSVLPPPGLAMNPDSTNVAISPNGRLVAFVVGTGVSTENQLWVRSLDTSMARRLEGGDGVAQPFWAPDSEHIGFFARGQLRTVAVSGGAPVIVCDAKFGRGGAWSTSNVIVFAPDAGGPLFRVSASGGPATPLTALDTAKGERAHRYPVFLPDGDHFLFASLPAGDDGYPIVASTLHDPFTRTTIGSMESAPVYAEPGSLLFTRQGVLQARPFDATQLRFTGDAVALGDEPAVAPGTAAYEAGRRISASSNGTLAYYLEPRGDTTVQWMDLAGKMIGAAKVPAGRYLNVLIAPDQTRAVFVRQDSAQIVSLWLMDLSRASAVPLWTGPGHNPVPVWSPDSAQIAFSPPDRGLLVKSVTSAAAATPIPRLTGTAVVATQWSRNLGLFFSTLDPETKWNIYRVSMTTEDPPVPVVTGPFIDVGGVASPDERWLAYLSDEAGRLDLFVQSIPGGVKTQVAPGSVKQMWWAADGRSLLYLKRDQTLWRVGVDLRGASPRIDEPAFLGNLPASLVAMDITRDGTRILAILPEHASLGAVMVVQGWGAAIAHK